MWPTPTPIVTPGAESEYFSGYAVSGSARQMADSMIQGFNVINENGAVDWVLAILTIIVLLGALFYALKLVTQAE